MHLHPVRLLAAMLALAALVLALLSPAASAQGYPPPPPKASISGTPKAGGVLTISGKASPNAPVTVTLGRQSAGGLSPQAVDSSGSQVLGSTVAGADGAYSLSVSIPTNLALGPWFLTVASNGEVLSSMAVDVAAPAAGDAGDTVAEQPAASAATPRATTQRGSLPVTGSTTALIVLAGVGMIALGGSAIVFGKRRDTAIV